MKKSVIAVSVLSAALAACGTMSDAKPWGNTLVDSNGNGVKAASGCVIYGGGPAQGDSCGVVDTPAPAPAPAPAPEPAPEPTPEPPTEPVYETVTISGKTLFAFDSAELSAEGRAELSRVASELGGLYEVNEVIVTGHTDSLGSEAYNQGLSERRAATVKHYLIDKGVKNVSSFGAGETQPVAPNDTRANRALNRRVDIRVDGSRRTY